MKTYGFGIVGCGMISEYHAAAIAELPNARLVAVQSRREPNRRKLMDKYGCEGTPDYAELAARKDIDVLCICTPSGQHLEDVTAGAKAGKQIIVEKPIEVSLERTDALVRACEDAGVTLCTAFPYRFGESSCLLKQAIDHGRFGRITVADCYNKWWRSQEYYDSAAWRGTVRYDGGACMNQGIHAIDLIQWFMGRPEELSAYTRCLVHERIEVEDTAVAAVRYTNGALGVIECTTSVWPGMSRRIEIHGDKGTVCMVDESFAQWEFADARPEDDEIRARLGAKQSSARLGAGDPRAMTHFNHREQFRDFLHALDAHTAPKVDGREGRKALEVVLAIYRAARTGARVKFPL